MDKREFVATVLREANLFVDEHESELRAAAALAGGPRSSDPGGRSEGERWALPEELEDALEEQLREVLLEADSLEDILKWSSEKEPPCALWRGASSWQEALAGAALGALAAEVRICAERILSGKLPRMRHVQVGAQTGKPPPGGEGT